MGIIQDRAIEKAAQTAPEKITQAVQGMADEHKAAVALAAVTGLADDKSKAAVGFAALAGVDPNNLTAEQRAFLKQLLTEPNPPS